MPNQLIVITNESTTLSDEAVAAVLPAMQEQLSGEFAQVWRDVSARVEFVAKGDLATAPTTAWQMIVADNSDQAGALGYHELSATNQPIGYVFAKSDVTYNESWTVTLSHELLEMVVDPFLVRTATYTLSDGSIVVASVEVGDAVESDAFGYSIGGVLVSDYCYPAWWGLESNTNGFDREGHASAPFNPASPQSSIPSQGYLGIWTAAGGWSQVVGADRVGDPHAVPQPGSRRARRMSRTKPRPSLDPSQVSARREALSARGLA